MNHVLDKLERQGADLRVGGTIFADERDKRARTNPPLPTAASSGLFGKPLSDEEISILENVDEVGNNAAATAFKIEGGRAISQDVPLQPRNTFASRVQVLKPDALRFSEEYDKNFDVWIYRDGRTVSSSWRARTRNDGVRIATRDVDGDIPSHSVRFRGTYSDAAYRGMAAAWGLPCSERCMPEMEHPGSTILDYLEVASRIGRITKDAVLCGVDARMAGVLPKREDDVLYGWLWAHMAASWVHSGLPIYELTTSIAAELLLTDPSKIPASAVRLPFDTLVVRLPVPLLNEPGIGEIKLLWIHKAVLSREHPENESLLIAMIPVQGKPRMAFQPDPAKMMEGTIANMGVAIQPDSAKMEGTIEDWINAAPSSVASAGENNLVRAVRRIVVNLALYVTDNPNAVSRPKPNPKQKTKTPKDIRPITSVIGRDIKLDKRILDVAKHWLQAQRGKRSERSEWQSTVRFFRQGHWNDHQVCGTKMRDPMTGQWQWGSERRRSWVRPHWVNPSGTTLFRHEFQVGTPEAAEAAQPDGEKE